MLDISELKRRADGRNRLALASHAELSGLLTLVEQQHRALEEAWPCGDGDCNEPAVWSWSDEDGVEYVCEKHKNYHFYAHGPSPHEPGMVVAAALDTYNQAQGGQG